MNFDLAKSYLQATDPSQIEYNKVNLDSVEMSFADLLKNNSTESEAEEDIKFINVHLRIRGGVKISDIYKIEDNKFSCKVPEDSYALKNVKFGTSMIRTYTFSNIFGPEFDQKKIFEIIVKPKLISFINGRNSTLFTYGASGSGKTYTIVGTPEQPGLIPRSLEYVFKSVPKLSLKPEVKPLSNGCVENITEDMITENEKYKNFIVSATLCDQATHIRTYEQMQNRLSMETISKVSYDSDVFVSAWISFAEIYNENIYDLLSLPDPKIPRPKLSLGKSKDESTYIKKLTSIHVMNGLEAYQILQYGLHNLNYASTAVNLHSSRSHCIFTIRLVQTSKNNKDVFISNFNFCDLAGSERLKKTMNFGDRLKESNNINTSLLVLGRCIDNIKKFQQVKDNRLIPFRESKLTQIFQKALMGHEHVDMIVNVNLCRDMFDETIHTLNFAALANTIILKEELPKAIKREMMQTQEKMEFQKVTTNKHSEFETLQKDLYESKEENKRLLRENNRLNLELENLNDPNDEVRRLNYALDIIIEERDNIIAVYQKKIIEEKESVANIYEESIARYEEMYRENKESALKRQRQEYEDKIAELQTIVISSDDDEESPQTSRDARRKDLEEKVLEYQTSIGELSENMKKTQEKLEFIENVLEDANEENLCLQLEKKRIRHENNELKLNMVELKEEVELLKLRLMDQSMYFHENFRGADNNEPPEC